MDNFNKPDFGYTAPIRTRKECKHSAFADKQYHRVGWFALSYHDGALPGYVAEKRCVNCGQVFKGIKARAFITSNRIVSIGL